jgi:hypothetical protein
MNADVVTQFNGLQIAAFDEAVGEPIVVEVIVERGEER